MRMVRGGWAGLVWAATALGAWAADVPPGVPVGVEVAWRPEGDSRPARPLHEVIPDMTPGGMVAGSAASLEAVSGLLEGAMAAAVASAPVAPPAQDSPRAARPPNNGADLGRLGAVRSGPVPQLDGEMAPVLMGLIVGRLGAQACPEVVVHRLLKGGAGFWAQCSNGDSFVVQGAGRRASVIACADGQDEKTCG